MEVAKQIDGMGNENDTAGSKKQKEIPLELTAYGTTPSGKPRLFVCQICTRAFARLEHLRRHERSHTKEKPFSCGVCQRRFSRRDLLLRHAQKLHAGCDDAITRLRRKSIKKSSFGSGGEGDDGTDSNKSPAKEMSNSPASSFNGQVPGKTSREYSLLSNGAGASGAGISGGGVSGGKDGKDAVQFNLDSFTLQGGPAKTVSRQGSIKENFNGSLQKQLFGKRRDHRNRGASFSAQSGANYAIGLPEFNDLYPGAENVEFSTPQLLPSTATEEQNWLNNLSTIPGLYDLNGNLGKKLARQNSISSISLENADYTANPPQPPRESISGQGQPRANIRSDSMVSTSSFNTFDSLSGLLNMLPGATISNSEVTPSTTHNSTTSAKTGSNEDYGYSFYDIPDNMVSNWSSQTKLQHSLATIRQEDDEMEDAQTTTSHSNNKNAPQNFDFLSHIDELTNQYDNSNKFVQNGYSFYVDSTSSSSGLENNSPQNTMSPGTGQGQYQKMNPQQTRQQLQPLPSDANYLNRNQLMNIENSSFRRKNSIKFGNYSRNKLFTNNIRNMINKALSKYPISGIMTPIIPSNEHLEIYASKFVNIFLSHFPFIHISKLNEYEIMSMTSNEDTSNESARVCLPLLIATMGALFANNKNDSEHLYEASRRTIHIYLESRKSSLNEESSTGNSSEATNPLWLIQSLTLSVVYGLFSENENNVYIVIRQLNALNSLVKTSLKSKKPILFSINSEDEDMYENAYDPKSTQQMQNSSLFSSTTFNVNDEIRYKNNINQQSQTRIILMIYRLTNFLLMMYNVPLTLSIHDLNGLNVPNKNDEYLWNFKNYQAFQEHNQVTNSKKSLNDHLSTTEENTIVFKDILFQIVRMGNTGYEANSLMLSKLNNLSQYGFISLAHGIFEMTQFQEMKNIDVFSVMDNLTRFINSDNYNNHIFVNNVNGFNNFEAASSKSQHGLEKVDYALLVNLVKINSLIDFKYVKEQSWLRNFDELTKNFSNFLTNINSITEYNYIRIVDCCIAIIKLVLMKSETGSVENQNLSDQINLNVMNLNESSSGDNLFSEFESSLSTAVFEKLIDIKVLDEIEISNNSIHSQMLFHVFAILSIFSIYVQRRNRHPQSSQLSMELTQRLAMVLKVVSKIEGFLKNKYQAMKMGTDLSQFLTNFDNNNQESNGIQNGSIHSFENTLYILKVGELVLSSIYDTSFKVCIFKKLGGSLSHIRKFLVENENQFLS